MGGGEVRAVVASLSCSGICDERWEYAGGFIFCTLSSGCVRDWLCFCAELLDRYEIQIYLPTRYSIENYFLANCIIFVGESPFPSMSPSSAPVFVPSLLSNSLTKIWERCCCTRLANVKKNCHNKSYKNSFPYMILNLFLGSLINVLLFRRAKFTGPRAWFAAPFLPKKPFIIMQSP